MVSPRPLVIAIALLWIGCGDNLAVPGVEAILVEPSNVQLAIGETQVVEADYRIGSDVVAASDASWKLSDPELVSVTGGGDAVTIRALGSGTATITASGSGYSADVMVTVAAAMLDHIAIGPAVPRVAAGTTLPVGVTATFTDGTTSDVTSQVTWTVDQPTIASVAGAVLSGLVRGEAQITASYQGHFSSTRVTVTTAVLRSIEVTPATPMIGIARTQQFVATGTFSDSSTQIITASVEWTSAMTTIATISDTVPTKGLATGVAEGTTTITATMGTISDTATLMVTPGNLVSITVTPALPDLAVGADLQLIATGTFDDGSMVTITDSVTWTSTDGTVAAVSATGLASALAVGSTSITATQGAISDSEPLTTFLAPVGTWVDADAGQNFGVPCIDGLKMAMAFDAIYLCSTTAGVIKGTIAGTVVTFAAANAGITNLEGSAIVAHTMAPTTLMYMSQPAPGDNWFRSGDAATTYTPSALVDSAGAPRSLYTGRFQMMVGNMLGSWDPNAGAPQAIVLTGNMAALTPRVVSTASGTVRSITGSAATNLYIAVHGQTPSGGAATGGVFHSTNNAMTWAARDTGIPTADKDLVFALAIDPTNASVLYAGLRGGGQLYKTTDGGTSWTHSATGLPARAEVLQLYVSPASATTLYAATTLGLYRTTDGGTSWELAGFQGRAVRAIVQSGTEPTLILVGVDDAIGLYRPM